MVHSPSVMQHQAYDRSEREGSGQKWQKWFKDDVNVQRKSCPIARA